MGRLLGFDDEEVAQRPNGVYCVKSLDHMFWKVGKTRDVTKRLISLDETAPFKLEGVFFIPWTPEEHEPPVGTPTGPRDEGYLEAWLLRTITDWRSHREWHRVEPQQLPSFAWTLLTAVEGWGRVVEGPGWRTLVDNKRSFK